MAACPLCETPGGELVWQTPLLRIILVNDPDYPGFCRVILSRHVAEMTDLGADERKQLMEVVYTVETVLRREFAPDKINLASLGNQVPHLHWHIIPRWADDRHFPNPVWDLPQRDTPARKLDIPRLKAALASAMLMMDTPR